ncbi:MAG: hypothetical protein K2J88_05120 [Oscillospiraceae bacterium]|nr:hypothetical protein [Oscillospiraceae bacterium]
MTIFLIIIILLLMLAIGFLLMSIQANQRIVQSVKENAEKDKDKVLELEQQISELEQKVKRHKAIATDLLEKEKLDVAPVDESVMAELAKLKEKYQTLQKNYQRVYQQLEDFQKDSSKMDKISPVQENSAPPELKDLQDKIERLEHSCGKLRLEKKQLQEHLSGKN